MAERSNFRLYNPANALGIDADEVRGKLISLALSKPESYYKLRETAIRSITKRLATDVYNMYFDILSEGIIPYEPEDRAASLGDRVMRNGVAKTQLIFPTTFNSPYAGQNFAPSLPEKEINVLCSKISDQIKQIGHNIIEEIMPINHLQMSQQKQTDILKAKGI